MLVAASDVASIGFHCTLEMYECPAAVIDDLELVKQAMRDAAAVSKSTLLGEVAHRFSPQGVTALGLLAESHISVHTWPELGYAAADIFTCGEHCLPEAACMLLVERLRAARYELHLVERGVPSPRVRPARAPVLDLHDPNAKAASSG
jgi:S-adenosylmethionine decarboxylase